MEVFPTLKVMRRRGGLRTNCGAFRRRIHRLVLLFFFVLGFGDNCELPGLCIQYDLLIIFDFHRALILEGDLLWTT
jgi:hypothetical protein